MFEERVQERLCLAIPRASLVACKRFLFENSVTLQELVTQLVIMVENNDPAIKPILQRAKTHRQANNKKAMVFTNSKAIYAALEFSDPLKNKEE
jgi:hypothetical protein